MNTVAWPIRAVWPLPALLAWLLAWGLHSCLAATRAPPLLALVLPTLLGAALATLAATRWRRVFIAIGFPLSLAASGASLGLPTWTWLAPLAALALLYPAHTWRDAPLFPTPAGALADLPEVAVLPAAARILDAGCGLGAALHELRRAYPQARLHGLEWSWPLRIACALRCRFATVRRADIWCADWSSFDLVYLFQRPENMARAWAKAHRELRPGSWLASLEFEVPGAVAQHRLTCPDGRVVWLYRCAAP